MDRSPRTNTDKAITAPAFFYHIPKGPGKTILIRPMGYRIETFDVERYFDSDAVERLLPYAWACIMLDAPIKTNEPVITT